MKKVILRILVPILVFVGCTFILNLFMNYGDSLQTADMRSATFPVMYMQIEGIQANRMNGTTEPIQDLTDRSVLTPVNMDRNITALIDQAGNTVSEVTYRVMSADRSTEIENAVLRNLDTSSEIVTLSFHLEQPILLNQEYILEFLVTLSGGKQIYYETRIVQRNELDLTDYLQFVNTFASNCLDKNQIDTVSQYVESTTGAGTCDFSDVDIHSSADEITWGSLAPSLASQMIPTIHEVNSVTLSVTQSYVISAVDEDGNTVYYMVSEFYRLRKGAQEVLLLDFERNAEQLFDPQINVLTSQGIIVGVTGDNVSYVTNVAEDIVAFVTNGDLWCYNRSAGKCTGVFTFRTNVGENPDLRDVQDNHNVRIIRVDDSGDITFVVYGYMNGGNHEGEMGADVFYYGAEQNLVEEKLFVPADCSYQTLEENIEKMSYVSSDGFLYLYIEGTLYQIQLSDGTYDTVAVNIPENGFVVSESQSLVAWMTSDGIGADSTICVLNLENHDTMVLTANEGECLRSLGFIDEDFICGSAVSSDVFIDSEGNVQYYMHTIWIYAADGTLRKEYHQDGYYVTGLDVGDGRVDLERVQKTDSGFVQADEDHITSGDLQTSKGVSSRQAVISSQTGAQLVLEFSDQKASKELLYLIPKYVYSEIEETDLNISAAPVTSNQYYVYGKGKLLGIYMSCADAIKLADENVGIVLNTAQQYVWERGVSAESVNIDPAGEPEGFRNASLDPDVLEDSLGENQELLNLTGCTASEIDYMLVNNRSVVVKTGENESRLLVGFDMFGNYRMYNPADGQITLIGSEDGPELFAEYGNVFFSYTSSFS